MSSDAYSSSQDAARAELLEFEGEIAKVKGLLRKLGPGGGAVASVGSPTSSTEGGDNATAVSAAGGDEDTSIHNRLSVVWVSVRELSVRPGDGLTGRKE